MPSKLIRKKSNMLLPAIPKQMLPALMQLTQSLGLPREALAPDEEIAHAWSDLPRELEQIPPELCGELIARMCVAVSTGLFDGAINYAWNATIIHLRQKIRDFGLPVVAQTLQRDFEERHLLDLQDSQLLDLVLKLGLVSEDGFFFLDQCRDTRNNFSAAHPTIGKINDREFTTFLNRCIRYALASDAFPRGIDVSAFIRAVNGNTFTEAQLTHWVESLDATHDAQRELLFGTLHGIYCDPSAPQNARVNAMNLCKAYAKKLTSAIKASLIDKHSDYVAKGDTERHGASQQFFEHLGLLSILNDSERHGVISSAINRLWGVHQGMNNFYNEPPFAERLQKLSEQEAIPDTIQESYVNIVIGCYIGNGYGVSNAAIPHYETMIRGFSPREIDFAVSLPGPNTIVGRRISGKASCKRNFADALRLIDKGSVPNAAKAAYDKYIQ